MDVKSLFNPVSKKWNCSSKSGTGGIDGKWTLSDLSERICHLLEWTTGLERMGILFSDISNLSVTAIHCLDDRGPMRGDGLGKDRDTFFIPGQSVRTR